MRLTPTVLLAHGYEQRVVLVEEAGVAGQVTLEEAADLLIVGPG